MGKMEARIFRGKFKSVQFYVTKLFLQFFLSEKNRAEKFKIEKEK
jgi:hypothetical protein